MGTRLTKITYEEGEREKIVNNMDLEKQQLIKEHIMDHKVKSNYDWILIKSYIKAWRGKISIYNNK